MRLILVRHGQTSCNVADIWHGWDECELTAEGHAQAEAVAARLASEPLAAVYSSDSRRALQTAAAIAARHALQPIPDAGLRERHAGEFEGATVAEIECRHPTVWQDRDADLYGWGPPGGESLQTVLERGLAVVERLMQRHPHDTVIAVTHMTMLRALICHFGQIPLGESYGLPFPSTGITIFTFEGERAQLELLNDASHADAGAHAGGAASAGSP